MKIHLRPLEDRDAPYMLEWMKDPSITRFFRFDASQMEMADCLQFIKAAKTSMPFACHFAIADENDAYLGTVSLKGIDQAERTAEYAISTRKCAHGTGSALDATHQLLSFAFDDLHLTSVYLNVLAENKRANSFYKKAGFHFTCTQEKAVNLRGEWKALNWYEIHPQDISRK